ncbi:hypothetical protein CPB86DRAFT_599950 [Serendipita vermifera]|nr:hypothetical protein CPB86DRAFT_599950 [Serendipita vermifera]
MSQLPSDNPHPSQPTTSDSTLPVPPKSNLPPSLMTCRDAEQDGSQDLTDSAMWSSWFLSADYQQVVRNANFHHKFQDGLIKLLKWIAEHPNENPTIEEFGNMLDPVDPENPKLVRCPKRDCGKEDTRVHIAAHMLQGSHSGLPVYYCIYDNKICQRFFHPADRDRHREKKHNILRPRATRKFQKARQTNPYPKTLETEKSQSLTEAVTGSRTTRSSAQNVSPPIASTSSTINVWSETAQGPSQAETRPTSGVNIGQEPSGPTIDPHFRWAPMNVYQVPNVGGPFLPSQTFYGLSPSNQHTHDRRKQPPQFSTIPNGIPIIPTHIHMGLTGSHQTHRNPAPHIPHQTNDEYVATSSTAGYYGYPNDPGPSQNRPQFQPDPNQYDQTASQFYYSSS